MRNVVHDLLHGGKLLQAWRAILELVSRLCGQQGLSVDARLGQLMIHRLSCKGATCLRGLHEVMVRVMTGIRVVSARAISNGACGRRVLVVVVAVSKVGRLRLARSRGRVVLLLSRCGGLSRS